jgi:hypothetical protein
LFPDEAEGIPVPAPKPDPVGKGKVLFQSSQEEGPPDAAAQLLNLEYVPLADVQHLDAVPVGDDFVKFEDGAGVTPDADVPDSRVLLAVLIVPAEGDPVIPATDDGAVGPVPEDPGVKVALDHPEPVGLPVGAIELAVLFGDVFKEEPPVGPMTVPLIVADELQQLVPVTQIELTTVEVGL